jgi:hypothetical protein
MTALFADTFYWIALADSTDSAHQRALTLTSERAASGIVTTDYPITPSCHSEEPEATKNPCICLPMQIPGSFAIAQDDRHPNFFTRSAFPPCL